MLTGTAQVTYIGEVLVHMDAGCEGIQLHLLPLLFGGKCALACEANNIHGGVCKLSNVRRLSTTG